MRRLNLFGRIRVFVSFFLLVNGMIVTGWSTDSAYGESSGNPPGGVDAGGSSAYWADKAGLCATYGNDAAAVAYYQKAIDLDPGQSNLYYLMGMSLGELGEYQKALEAVNKAIAMNPGNPNYLYGRGRLGLKAGNTQSAMADLESAAKGGDRDAKNHMDFLTR